MLRHVTLQRMVVAVLTALLLLNLTSASVLAATSASGKIRISEIERSFRLAKEDVQEIEIRLARAEAYNAEVGTTIAALRAKGYNTLNLDEAKADFEVHLQNLRAELKESQALVLAHPGFDAQGKVLDRGVARQTAGDLKTCIKTMRTWGGNIYTDMHREFDAFYHRNPGVVFTEPVRPTKSSLF
jgi:hypothetical protein